MLMLYAYIYNAWLTAYVTSRAILAPSTFCICQATSMHRNQYQLALVRFFLIQPPFLFLKKHLAMDGRVALRNSVCQ
jgi:hypothetical protein